MNKTIKHVIFKCWHRAFPLLFLRTEENSLIIRNFTFTSSCRYRLDDGDQYDWNKLFGFFVGLFGIHKNSARFVWRYNPNEDLIEIGVYWYLNGYRCWHKLASLPLNKEYAFKISILKDSVVFTVLDDYVAINRYVLYMEDSSKTKYKCGIYFGGNKRAPQRIEILESI